LYYLPLLVPMLLEFLSVPGHLYLLSPQIAMSNMQELGSEYLKPVSDSYLLLEALKLNNNFREG